MGKVSTGKDQGSWGERTDRYREDARGSGDDQTERDGEEGVERLQTDGTVTVDDTLVFK